MKRPLVIDLFCGLGGWTRGFLAEGWDAVGFDIERHVYGEKRYPAQLVLQDVLTLHGSQFAGVDAIVASPPCQAYSKRAMPFGQLWREHCAMDDDGAPAGNYPMFPPIDNRLFRACFRIQHGMHKTVEYRTWAHMNYRCSNPNAQGWLNYGGRGIRVCDRWRNSFESFFQDLGLRPSNGHSLDRYPDNNGNYEPGNVRWATRTEQRINKRPILWERCLMMVAQLAGLSEEDVRQKANEGRSDVDLAQWIASVFRPVI